MGLIIFLSAKGSKASLKFKTNQMFKAFLKTEVGFFDLFFGLF